MELYCSMSIRPLARGFRMKSSLRTQPTTADAIVDAPLPDALATLAKLNVESTVAVAAISRRRILMRLIVANALAWIAIIMVIKLILF